MTVRLNLGALPDSKYAAQLQKSPSPARFPAALEREFIRDSLDAQGLIVRFACTLPLLLVGPLFFFGLPFRAGLLSAALATALALHQPPATLLGGSGLPRC
jgi:hypothetical protein